MAKEKPKKVDVVRAALADGIDGNQDIVEYAKAKHNVVIDPKHVSVIKSGIKKKKAMVASGASVGNGVKLAAGASVKTAMKRKGRAPKVASNGTFTIRDVVAVKALVTRLGKKGLAELADAVG